MVEKTKSPLQIGKYAIELKISEFDKSSGRRVLPSTVRASDLAELITNFEDAVVVLAADSGDLDPDKSDDDADISLVSIGEGSNLLGIAISSSVRPSTIQILQALTDGEFKDISVRCYSYLKNMFKQSVKMGWSLEISGGEDFDFRVAFISKDNPIPEIKRRTARGGTNIYGKLMRIGNDKPSARVKLSDRTTITVEMTRQMVKDLESRHKLYDVVGFEGEATWVVEGWKIVEFQAKRIIGYHSDEGGFASMFEKLAESGGDRWKDVDVIEYVNKLRGR